MSLGDVVRMLVVIVASLAICGFYSIVMSRPSQVRRPVGTAPNAFQVGTFTEEMSQTPRILKPFVWLAIFFTVLQFAQGVWLFLVILIRYGWGFAG